jgi:hypothetical protein
MRFLSNLFSDEAIAKAMGEDQASEQPEPAVEADEAAEHDAPPPAPLDPDLPDDWFDSHG